jgi:hypothetical protein
MRVNWTCSRATHFCVAKHSYRQAGAIHRCPGVGLGERRAELVPPLVPLTLPRQGKKKPQAV